MTSPQTLSTIWFRLAENVDFDFLEFILITSRAGGKIPSEGRPFGVGKSSLAIWMAYRTWAYYRGSLYFVKEGNRFQMVDETPEDERVKLMSMIVRHYLKFSIIDVVETVKNARSIIPALIWDDVQRTCPAYQKIPHKLRELVEYLTLARPRLKNLIMTAPSMSDIAKPLRAFVTWEVIVPTRGVYEIQFIGKKRDFYRPTEDRSQLIYDSEGSFQPLPPEIDRLYKQVRDEALNRIKMIEEEGETQPQIDLSLLRKIPKDLVLEKVREKGHKFSQSKGRNLVNAIIDTYLELLQSSSDI